MLGRDRGGRQKAKSASSGILVFLLLLALVMPFYFYLGNFRISPYRAYMIIAIVPVLVQWARGAAGPVYTVDFLVILAALLMPISLFVNHGVAKQWEFSGILAIETLAPYFIARVLVRDINSFRSFVRGAYIIIIVLLPFAVIESFTGRKIILDLFDVVFEVYKPANQEPRLGLNRAQVSMPHPILFGVFCSSAFALIWYSLGSKDSLFKRVRRGSIVGAAVFLSLSAGAFMGVLIQGFLIFWDEIFKRKKSRWIVLSVGVFFILTALELGSNRNVFQIIASELTFSKSSGYNRILIFTHAKDDILNSPIFGIGFRWWTRPLWLKGSVDNFWLLISLRYGLPLFFTFFSMYLTVIIKTIRVPLVGYSAGVRTGYVISLIGIGLAAFTVHLWESTYCLFLFLLGSGAWFWSEVGVSGDGDIAGDDKGGINSRSSRARIRYTRFPKK
ncbi:O-antigen ligase family protein [Ruegeria sp. HKCCSP335]|nr:O-antigen ligase family protein [Ruegeria sp. HKCCSP335]